MNNINRKPHRILSIAPNTRGFGFAVLEGDATLIDQGVKNVKGDKNAGCLATLGKQLDFFVPDVIVHEDYAAKGSRRCERIRMLGEEIDAMATGQRIKVASFSNKEIRKVFSEDGRATKHVMAGMLALRFSEELRDLMPPERKIWMNEAYHMAVFDAVALAMAYFGARSRVRGSVESLREDRSDGMRTS